MTDTNKTNENAGFSQSDLAGSGEIALNDSGTREKIDTPLTQWRSPTVRWPMIYFIRSEDAIKIGYSRNPETRLGELQVGTQHTLELLGVMHGDMVDEGNLHKRFADLHIRGEWFRSDRVLLDFIAGTAEVLEPQPVPEPPPPPPAPIKRLGPSLEALAVIGGLIRLREFHGAGTPIGHCCSLIVEQIKELANYVRPEWAKDERQTLPWLMNRSMNRLAQLRAALS